MVNNIVKNWIVNCSNYSNNNNEYIGIPNIYSNNYMIYIIIPIYMKIIYKINRIDNIYNRNIYMIWNNNYIIISNNNKYNIIWNYVSILYNIRNKNQYICSNKMSNINYSNRSIYYIYIVWYTYSNIAINMYYKYIVICIHVIYNPIFNIDIYSKYIYSIHTNYTIENIYITMYRFIRSLNNYSNMYIYNYSMYSVGHNGRWNITKNNINSTHYYKLYTISNNYSNVDSGRFISKNEYGTNSINMKLYYYNNIIFNTEYIF